MIDALRLRQISLRRLIWFCLGVITVVFVAVSVASVIGQVRVSRAVTQLSDHVMPIQSDVEALRRAFTDQEAGLRAFMLTGSALSLEPYRSAVATADQRITRLTASLSDDRRGSRILDDIKAAAAAWQSGSTEPQIAARADGVLRPDLQEEMTLRGKQQFDELRSHLRVLATHAGEKGRTEVAHIQAVQRISTIVQVVGAAVLAVVVIAVLILVQRLLTRPVNTLVREVKAVADGDYDQEIHSAGPREIAAVSEAVERMRENLRGYAEKLVDSELREEQARIAADLHDHVIQRVFGLGLGLTSAAGRRNTDLVPFIDETDAIIRDLREAIFNLQQSVSPGARFRGLRAAIIDIVECSEASLGFPPSLRFDGQVDELTLTPELQAALLAVIREALSNVARHAQATAVTVCIDVAGAEISILVRDNGVGVADDDVMGDGRRNIVRRARDLGGTASIRKASPEPGTIVEWRVPLPPQARVGSRTARDRQVEEGERLLVRPRAGGVPGLGQRPAGR